MTIPSKSPIYYINTRKLFGLANKTSHFIVKSNPFVLDWYQNLLWEKYIKKIASWLNTVGFISVFTDHSVIQLVQLVPKVTFIASIASGLECISSNKRKTKIQNSKASLFSYNFVERLPAVTESKKYSLKKRVLGYQWYMYLCPVKTKFIFYKRPMVLNLWRWGTHGATMNGQVHGQTGKSLCIVSHPVSLCVLFHPKTGKSLCIVSPQDG